MSRQLLLVLLILAIQTAPAQQPVTDTVLQDTTYNAVDMYYKSLGEQSPLFTGSEYINYPIFKGHQFFESPTVKIGTIHFDEMVFTGVPILYDIVRDQVVVLHYKKVFLTNLPSEKIEQFQLLGHTFIRLAPRITPGIEPGFYDRLYNGKTSLFIKRRKITSDDLSEAHLNTVVEQKDIYYIRKDGNYHLIRNIRTLLDVLKNQKTEIRKYLKKNNIRFRTDPEKAILKAVEHYDRLSN